MNDNIHQIEYLKAMNQKLGEQEHIYKLLIQRSENAFVYYSFKSGEIHTLGLFGDFFDFTVESHKQLDVFTELVDSDHVVDMMLCLYPENMELLHKSAEFYVADKKKWYLFETNVILDKEGNPSEKVIKITDITLEHDNKNEILYLAYYDSLTGLYNRTYFIAKLNEMISKAKENDQQIAIINIDIDEFKRVNDGLGMNVGDEVLIKFGSYLKSLENN